MGDMKDGEQTHRIHKAAMEKNQSKATAWNDLSHGVWWAQWMHKNLEEEGREKKRRKGTKSVIMPISLTFLSYQLVRTICLLPARYDSGFRFFLWTASVLRHSLKQKIQTSYLPALSTYKTPIFRCTLHSKNECLMCRSCVCLANCLSVKTSEVRKPQGKRLFEGCRCRTEGNNKTDLREIQWNHYKVWRIARTSL